MNKKQEIEQKKWQRAQEKAQRRKDKSGRSCGNDKPVVPEFPQEAVTTLSSVGLPSVMEKHIPLVSEPVKSEVADVPVASVDGGEINPSDSTADISSVEPEQVSSVDEPEKPQCLDSCAKSAEEEKVVLHDEDFYRRLFDSKTRDPGWWDNVLVYGKDDIDGVQVDEIIFINPNDARRDEKQPRQFFDQALLWQLSHAIFVYGQQETAQVYRNPDKSDIEHPWIILNGERRWRATLQANLPYKVQVVPPPIDDLERLKSQVTSNENRIGLSDLEIGRNIAELRQFGTSVPEIMLLYGKSDAWVYQHLAILEIIPEVQDMLSPEKPEDQRLSMYTAIRLREVLPEKQLETAKRIVGKTGFEAREIIREVISQSNAPKSGRQRRGSDDLDIFRNMLNHYLARLKVIAEYSDERFGKMFLNLLPQTYVEHAKLLSSVSNQTKAVKERMFGFLPKGVNVKSKPEVQILASTKTLTESKKTKIVSPDFQGSVSQVLGQMLVYFSDLAQEIPIVYEDVPSDQLETILNQAEAASLSLASFRLGLSKKIGRKSTSSKPIKHEEESSGAEASSSTPEYQEFARLLQRLQEMSTEGDQELAEKFGSTHMQIAGLNLAIEKTIKRLNKMMQACNRAIHGRM